MQAICHCTDCQHEGGSFSDSAVFPPDTLKYTAGQPTKYDQKGASGKNVEHYFCGKCGSTLVIMQEVLVRHPGLCCGIDVVQGGLIVVRVGSFSGEGNSGTEWFKPGAELWWHPN